MSENLTLEKIKVVERLQALETKLDVLIPEIQKSNATLAKILTGNGDVKTGLAFRVNTLESDKDKKDGYFVAIGSVLGLVVAGILTDFVIRLFHK